MIATPWAVEGGIYDDFQDYDVGLSSSELWGRTFIVDPARCYSP